MKVLIDGENLRHQLAHVLFSHNKILHKNDYFSFDLANFLHEILNESELEVTYYTTRIRQPQNKIPATLQKQITSISNANRRWVADLTNQAIRVEKAGYLRVRESNVCIHCGKKTLVLQEKGVDVRVATDLVLSQKTVRDIVLVSSDSDLTPALHATRTAGMKTRYLCYSAWLNRSVAAQAYKTITFDDALVLKHFKGKKS